MYVPVVQYFVIATLPASSALTGKDPSHHLSPDNILGFYRAMD